MFDSTQVKATVDQSVNLPDYFSCKNCMGYQYWLYCQELRQQKLCAKEMLRDALQTGTVQVVLHLPTGGAR